jgi:hypothetical protein
MTRLLLAAILFTTLASCASRQPDMSPGYAAALSQQVHRIEAAQ